MLRPNLLLFMLALGVHATAQLESIKYPSTGAELPAWVQLMYGPDPDAGAVEAAFKAYYAAHPFVKNSHTQYYKRWKRELVHDLVPKDPVQRANYAASLRDYLDASEALGSSRAASWTAIGPFDWDHGAASKSYACGAAHVYTVEQSISNTNLVYAGTANCGVWKSTDKGQNWTNMTKTMMVGQVLSVEIDFSDENTVYFGAEGDLWKTTTGGSNWTSIGDASFQSLSHSIREIALFPTNNQRLFVCSDQGLYRSDNAGASFTQVQAGIWQELEFKPSDPNTIYAVKQVNNRTEFWRSTNGGTSFSQIGTGWPVPVSPDEQERTEIAVSPAAPNTVYALCTGAANGGSGLYGVYKSIDQGVNWTFQCCGTGPAGVPSPTNFNLMGWDDGGQDDGGQYYYDLALAIAPTNASKVHVCGVQRWVSTDSGVNFTCPAKWSHSNKPDYIHADIHDMRFYGNDLWIACDGGIFYSNDGGANFNRRMFGISGTDFWGFGQGGWTGSQVLLGGTYHNGTLLKDNNVYTNGWISTDGGDNFRGFVHPQYDRRALSDYGYKILSGDRTVANGNGAWARQPNASYIVGESSEVAWHPNLVDAAYVGNGTALWLTNDNGASFAQVHDFGETVTSIELAFSDPNTIYVCTYLGWWDTKHVWRSVDAGANWTDITPSSAQLNGNVWVPYDIAVSGTDPQTIWLVRTSQYGDYPNHDGYVAYKSVNGGSTWTNITSTTLNGEWPTNIAHQIGSTGGLYIGTRRAVYYRSDAAPTWALWNAGLPARIFSTRLLINYKEGKVRNGTDRSVWESLLEAPAPPVANFAADRRNPNCLTPAVQFWDNSALSGTGATWAWNFPGGSPSTSSIRNPLVTYSSPGVYDVSLTVTDVNGSNSRTIAGFITFNSTGTATPFVQDVEGGQAAPAGWTLQNPDALDTWSTVSLAMGADCVPTTAWRLDNYYYNAPGQEDRLVTPIIDLAGSAGTRLRFDHAYAPYGGGYDDGFRVEISTNCGSSWTPLYSAVGAALATAPQNTGAWEPAACSDWLAHDIDLSAYDGQNILLRFTAINDYGNRLYLDNVEVVNSGVRLALKVLLEGPYDGGTLKMRDDLRIAGLIPPVEPYTAAGFVQAADGGGEALQPGVTSATGDNAVVDWVLVELRSWSAPATIVATRSALVQRDGDVVAEDGISPISLLATAGFYHVAVRHRNHLGCMTASSVGLSTTATAIDLTATGTATYGTQARKMVGARNVLWAGNARRDTLLKYTNTDNDREPILTRIGGVVPTNSVAGYFIEDNTLDGVVKYTGTGNDREPILVNIGGTVPTATRLEQLP